MPRVSEILDRFPEPYLIEWKLKKGAVECKRISDEALLVGSIVDLWIQKDIREEYYELSLPDKEIEALVRQQIMNCMNAWNKFKKDHPGFIEKAKRFKDRMQAELVMGDLVGHPDFIFDDELPDLKTSSSISKSHWMQTSIYTHMAQLQLGLSIHKASILRLDKKDPNGVYEYKSIDRDEISFWQRKFLIRYEIYKEDQEFHNMTRKKLEEEKLA